MWINRHRTLVSAICVALVAIVLVTIGALPLYRSVREYTKKITIKSAELEKLTSRVEILSKLDANVLQERVNILDNALPVKKDVLLYLDSINGLSRELGLTFGGISLTPGELSEATGSAKKNTQMNQLQSLETEVKMRGGQENVYAFLGTIEKVLPLMQIKNIKVSILGEDQYALTLNLGMLWAEQAAPDLKGQVTLFGDEEEKYFNQLAEYRRFEQMIYSPIPSEPKGDLFANPEVIPLP